MKRFAPIAFATMMTAISSIGANAQAQNPWNPAPVAPLGQVTAIPPAWPATAPVANPYAPADLEQQLATGRGAAITAPVAQQPAQPTTPQYAPSEQNPAPTQQNVPASPYQQYQQYQQFPQFQQLSQASPYGAANPYYQNAPLGGYAPNTGYGGMPGNYGYNLPYGYGNNVPYGYGNNVPYGYGNGVPYGNGFGGFPSNSGGYGSPYSPQYGNIPSGSSPFFGSNSPFGFW